MSELEKAFFVITIVLIGLFILYHAKRYHEENRDNGLLLQWLDVISKNELLIAMADLGNKPAFYDYLEHLATIHDILDNPKYQLWCSNGGPSRLMEELN